MTSTAGRTGGHNGKLLHVQKQTEPEMHPGAPRCNGTPQGKTNAHARHATMDAHVRIIAVLSVQAARSAVEGLQLVGIICMHMGC